jgi:hypothetical protein
MKRTALRQAEYETSLSISASRTQVIDAAVGRLQVQMEEVIARLDRYDERLIAPYLPIVHNDDIEEQSNDV